MKKHFMSAILIATLITMAPAAFAGNHSETLINTTTKGDAGHGIQVWVVGEENNEVVLQLRLQKADSRAALLRITDVNGEVLHTERFKSREFARFIRVSPDELSSIQVVLEAQDGTSRKVYNISQKRVNTIQVEEVNRP